MQGLCELVRKLCLHMHDKNHVYDILFMAWQKCDSHYDHEMKE